MSTVKFVNHASFIIESDNIKLICDPWLDGTAFNNGWRLISETLLPYEDFKNITHIWFSHEHPDHFAPPNLKKIPLDYRKRITVLFQETIDNKVLAFCKKLEFHSCISLKADKTYSLSNNFQIKCNPYTYGDSWALFTVDGIKILNLNDCVVSSLIAAKKLYSKTGSIDVLFTQFGYANKIGNAADVKLREQASLEKLQRIKLQSDALNPKVIVPFASYVQFCHKENVYMNEGMNKIRDVYKFIQDTLNVKCNVLYPNDVWNVAESWDSDMSISKYESDLNTISNKEVLQSNKYEFEAIQKEAIMFCRVVKEKTRRYAKLFDAIFIKFYCTDHNASYVFDLDNGLLNSSLDSRDCDVVLSSESLWYMFKHLWGGDTLYINGRYQIPQKGDVRSFDLLRETASQINKGEAIKFPSKLQTLLSMIQVKLSLMFNK
jgi:hypothetical protein